MKVLLDIFKEVAFWVLLPVLLIAIGVGFGWLAITFSSLVCAGIAFVLIVVGAIWLGLTWGGYIG